MKHSGNHDFIGCFKGAAGFKHFIYNSYLWKLVGENTKTSARLSLTLMTQYVNSVKESDLTVLR